MGFHPEQSRAPHPQDHYSWPGPEGRGGGEPPAGERGQPPRKIRPEGRPTVTLGPTAWEGRRGGDEDAGAEGLDGERLGAGGARPQCRGRKEGLTSRRDDAEVEQNQRRNGARGASEEAAQRPGSNNAGFCRRRHRTGFARRLTPAAAARGLGGGVLAE
jgi:hypothetical protein